MTESKKKYDVFLSFSEKDRKIVDLIKTELKEKGILFFDYKKEKRPGVDTWEGKIYPAIEDSKIFLFVITAHYVQSSSCIEELKHANSLRINGSLELFPGCFEKIFDYNSSKNPAILKRIDAPKYDPNKNGCEKFISDIVSCHFAQDENVSVLGDSHLARDSDISQKEKIWTAPWIKTIIFSSTTRIGGMIGDFPSTQEILEKVGRVVDMTIDEKTKKISTWQLNIDEQHIQFTLPSPRVRLDSKFIEKVKLRAAALGEKYHLLITEKDFENQDFLGHFSEKINKYATKLPVGSGVNSWIIILYLPSELTIDERVEIVKKTVAYGSK
ncbi:MAG: toll/interleukin-1 receptor domain-containing protein [Caldisericia bacterium]|nr:toll/interleukin-1 receptor domain-containing protein [Caldisericia bacterium]